jgi:glycosyltransferase involved in cell wall biosynthesis
MREDRRRLLAICWEMPPLSGPRAVQVSRLLNHLVPLGWDSSVVAFAPRSDRYFPDADLARRLAPADGVDVVRVRSAEEHFFFRALWRVCPPLKGLPDEKWVWTRRAVRAARALASKTRFDALVTFAQPWTDHVIGRRLRRHLGLPWVAHFSDPWVDSPYHFPRWQRRVWRPMERAVVRDADALVFVTSQTADRTMAKYPPEWKRKARVVPHGFDACMLPPRRESGSSSGPLRLVYTGRFYRRWRTPEHLFRAAATLVSADPSSLEIVVAGTIDPEWIRLAAQLGLSRAVTFRGRLSWAESMSTAMSADALLVIDAPSDVNLFLPSKLIEYLPLDKPILGLTPDVGASADLLRRLGYPIAPPDDVEEIEQALRSLVASKRSGSIGPSRQHRDVASSYEVKETTAQFAAVLSSCVRPH